MPFLPNTKTYFVKSFLKVTVMSLSNTEKEMQCVLHWFTGWSAMQRNDFLHDLLDKLVPANVDTLFDSMQTLGVQDRPPSIFQCQLKLFGEWFSHWSDTDRNGFMIQLRTIDSAFVNRFELEAARVSR